MTGTKVLLILLILMVVLFVVFVYWSTGQDKAKPSDPNTAVSKAPPFMDTLNGMLAPFGPKLKAKELQPPLTVFDLQSGLRYSVMILPDGDHKFRQAKFTVRPSKACVHISFEASGAVPNDMARTQSFPNNDDHDKNSNELTFTIFSGGGKLTVDRSSLPCKVSLQ